MPAEGVSGVQQEITAKLTNEARIEQKARAQELKAERKTTPPSREVSDEIKEKAKQKINPQSPEGLLVEGTIDRLSNEDAFLQEKSGYDVAKTNADSMLKNYQLVVAASDKDPDTWTEEERLAVEADEASADPITPKKIRAIRGESARNNAEITKIDTQLRKLRGNLPDQAFRDQEGQALDKLFWAKGQELLIGQDMVGVIAGVDLDWSADDVDAQLATLPGLTQEQRHDLRKLHRELESARATAHEHGLSILDREGLRFGANLGKVQAYNEQYANTFPSLEIPQVLIEDVRQKASVAAETYVNGKNLTEPARSAFMAAIGVQFKDNQTMTPDALATNGHDNIVEGGAYDQLTQAEAQFNLVNTMFMQAAKEAHEDPSKASALVDVALLRKVTMDVRDAKRNAMQVAYQTANKQQIDAKKQEVAVLEEEAKAVEKKLKRDRRWAGAQRIALHIVNAPSILITRALAGIGAALILPEMGRQTVFDAGQERIGGGFTKITKERDVEKTGIAKKLVTAREQLTNLANGGDVDVSQTIVES